MCKCAYDEDAVTLGITLKHLLYMVGHVSSCLLNVYLKFTCLAKVFMSGLVYVAFSDFVSLLHCNCIFLLFRESALLSLKNTN